MNRMNVAFLRLQLQPPFVLWPAEGAKTHKNKSESGRRSVTAKHVKNKPSARRTRTKAARVKDTDVSSPQHLTPTLQLLPNWCWSVFYIRTQQFLPPPLRPPRPPAPVPRWVVCFGTFHDRQGVRSRGVSVGEAQRDVRRGWAPESDFFFLHG